MPKHYMTTPYKQHSRSTLQSSYKLYTSKRQPRKQRYPPINPMRLRLVRRNLNKHHEISRMPCRRQCPRPRQRFIHRRIIKSAPWLLPMLLRFQPYHRHLCIQLLWLRLPDNLRIRVPPGSLHKKPADVASVVRPSIHLSSSYFGHYSEGEGDCVDRVGVLSGEVLKGACEEGLREEEARDPVGGGDAIFDPAVDEGDALEEVDYPAAKGLEGGVGFVSPELGDLVV